MSAGASVTLVQPEPYHYYSGMGPGMLGGSYREEEIRLPTKKQVLAAGADFIEARAAKIDAAGRRVYLENHATPLAYDLLSCNTGSSVENPLDCGFSARVVPVKPISGLALARKEILSRVIRQKMRIAVVGGGPSAVEIAGNLRQLCMAGKCIQPVIALYAGSTLLGDRNPKIRVLTRKILGAKQIEIHENIRVCGYADNHLVSSDGRSFMADMVFLATGVRPSPIFDCSDLARGEGGGLLVNSYLQSVSHPEVFGGGDCIAFQDRPLDKVGVYAVRQNPVLLENLLASLRGLPLTPFQPGGKYLLIYNLGAGDAIFARGSLIFTGAIAYHLKTYLDKRFIKKA